MKRIDLTGQTFGWLEVKEYSHTDKHNKAYWKCICHVCGNATVTSSASMRNGMSKSCGCMKNCVDITGQQFGQLEALKPLNKMLGDSRVWLFKCLLCGNICETTVESVKWGGKISCGCAKKSSEIVNATKAREAVHWVEKTNVNRIKSTTLPKNNTSGVKGVSWRKRERLWVARIGFKGKLYNLGYFKELEDAIKVRKNAEQLTHEAFLEWYEKYKDNLDDAPESPDGLELEKRTEL